MSALRAIPAGILAGASAILAGASKLAEIGARRLAPPTRPEPRDSPAEERAPYMTRTETPAPTPRTETLPQTVEPLPEVGVDTTLDTDLVIGTEPGPDTPAGRAADVADDGEARTYESHIAELAEQNVSAVVRGIQDLSTEELGELFDYESAHRKRKTVLQAIERAAAPPTEEQTVTSTPE